MMKIYSFLINSYEKADSSHPDGDFTDFIGLQETCASYKNKQKHGLYTDSYDREFFIRYALTDQIGITSESVIFGRGGLGKPYCRSPYSSLFFNVSHSGRWYVCATSGQEIGVDIQEIYPLSQKQQEIMAKKILSVTERKKLKSLISNSDRTDFLFTCFSIKESCAKAVGLGISMHFPSIITEKHDDCYLWTDTQKSCYYIREYILDSGYKLFLCSTDPSRAALRKILVASVAFGKPD
jgi:4'-phosphopantetheinyl transferase